MINHALNLLPPKLQAEQRSESRYAQINALIRIPMVAGIVLAVITQGVIFVMDRHATDLKKDEVQARAEAAATPSADVTKLTKQVNSQIAVLRKTLGPGRLFQASTIKILNSLPKGITVKKLSIDQAGNIILEGTAATRGTFLELQDVMRTSTVLKNATTSSTASKRDQLPFIYTAKIPTS